MFKVIVIAMLSFIILYLTNPSKEEFIDFYSAKINEEKQNKTITEKLFLEGEKIFVTFNVDRKDRYIYSVYTVNYSGEKEVYIGVVKKFILKEKAKGYETNAMRTYNKIVEKTGRILEKGSDKVGELMETNSETK